MNLKHYALTYGRRNLTWLDGSSLQSCGATHSQILAVDMAIFLMAELKRRFAYRATSPCPAGWDAMIEDTSSKLAGFLAELGGDK